MTENKDRAKQVLENEIEYRENEKAKWESVGQKSTYDDERIQALKFAKDNMQDEWVDVRDRLPSEEGEYLVTQADTNFVLLVWYAQEEKMWIDINNTQIIGIIAWKPLPKPYERKE